MRFLNSIKKINKKVCVNKSPLIFIVLLMAVLLISSFLNTTTAYAETDEDILPLVGNRLANPNLMFTQTAQYIPNWNIYATDNMLGGQGGTRTIYPAVNNERRNLNINGFSVIEKNENYNFRSYVSAKSAGDNAFMLLAQTHNSLNTNKYYYFRAEVTGSGKVSLLVYPGTSTSGDNPAALINRTVQLREDKVEILEIRFKPSQAQNTLSIRHRSNTSEETFVNIKRLGFYMEDDYILQKRMNALFEDAGQTKLANISKESFEAEVAAIKTLLTKTSIYSAEVIVDVQAKIEEAEALRKSMDIVEDSLKEYNFEVLGKETIPDKVQQIAQKQTLEITKSNYKDKDLEAIEAIILAGKTAIDDYYLTIETKALVDQVDAAIELYIEDGDKAEITEKEEALKDYLLSLEDMAEGVSIEVSWNETDNNFAVTIKKGDSLETTYISVKAFLNTHPSNNLYVNTGYRGEIEDGNYDTPYKTLAAALSVAKIDGDTIMFQSDVSISAQHNIEKNLTFSTADIDMDGNPIDERITIKKAAALSICFNIKDNTELILKNIIIDGNKASYKPTLSRLFFLDGTATTNPTLTIKEGTLIQNGYTVNGAAVCQGAVRGTLNMYGGLITNNEANVGLSTFYIPAGVTLNLFGGEITGNISKGSTMSIQPGVVVNLGGNIKIYNNTGSSKNNLVSDSNLINVTEDFTGEVYIYTNYYVNNNVFGNITPGVSISKGIFVNMRNTYASAGVDASNQLLWTNGYYVNTSFTGSTANGLYNTPYKTLAAAISAAADGSVILVQNNMTLTSAVTVNKNISIQTADIDLTGNPIIVNGYDDNKVIARGPSFTGNLINVNVNKTLTLKNITIDGNLSREKSIDGASIVLGQSGNTSYATLIIQDGTFITKGYRTSGGGTIRIYHAKIEMYGGRISENYGHSSAFGIYTTGDLKAYLYGGEISNNYSLSVTNTMSVISEIVVGGKFAFKDNNSITDETLGLNLKLESLNKTNLQIREDFDGYILVDDSAPERFKVIKAIYLGDNVNGDIKAFSIQP